MKRDKTWEITLEPGNGLPEGQVMITRSLRPGRKGDSVHAVYVVIPERGDKAASTRAFDDGAVVVEFDERDRIIGIELLNLTNPSRLKEFSKFADSEQSGEVAQVFWTAHHIWHDVHLITKYLEAEGGKADLAVFKKVHPSASRWRESTENRLALA